MIDAVNQLWSPCWQFVTCRSCGKKYECTVEDDYYNSTCATDGVCGSCLGLAS